MAKRYKENMKTKKGHFNTKENVKHKRNINIKKILIFFILILIILVAINIVKIALNSKKITAENIEKIDTNKYEELVSDLLIPSDLNNEILEIISNKDIKIVRIHYKLENLNKGTVNLIYLTKENNLLKIDVDIESKKIKTMEIVEEDINRTEITTNLNEDIKEDFENNKDRINLDEGQTRLNIIMTSTEIIVNAE